MSSPDRFTTVLLMFDFETKLYACGHFQQSVGYAFDLCFGTPLTVGSLAAYVPKRPRAHSTDAERAKTRCAR